MPETIRILLVDDQRLMREGLHILLELEPDLKIAGEADSGGAALKAYAELQPDVVLMDVRMPGMDGVEATWRMRERWATCSRTSRDTTWPRPCARWPRAAL